MRRQRNTKIVATLGPASSSPEMIEALFMAGADVFRLNFSHGNPEDHRRNFDAIRMIEKKTGRAVGALADLQGPKLRLGTFATGQITLKPGQNFHLDLDKTPGNQSRAPLPHPEIFAAIKPGDSLLLDDGRVRLEVKKRGADFAETVVAVGGKLSDRKGVNVPGTVLGLSPITDKDRRDLNFALELGVDWIALSFVQRAEDLAEARRLIAGRAALITKLEKPSAVADLDRLIELSDGIMVARGDLGVEMPPEEVPSLQRTIVGACRLAGKPVIVATQMLDSMVASPTPTRAEASDVAAAVYEGADAVMLSAESAAGQFPIEAVAMMSRIAERTECDPSYHRIIHAERSDPEATAADAIVTSAAAVAATIKAAAIVTFSLSGSTTLRAARQRPQVPILGLSPKAETARRCALAWGVHPVITEDVSSFSEMTTKACLTAAAEGFAVSGQRLVVIAGVPFGTPGSTNILRIAWVD
ncbi:MAG: pyruvate kinase [Alphaproteobacteria bacterium]